MKFECPFNPALQAVWIALTVGVGAPFNTLPKIKLMKNNPAIGATTVLADIDEADFTGYGPTDSSDVPGVLFDVELSKWVLHNSLEAPGPFYTHGVPGVANLIYGAYAVNTAGTVLLGVAKLAQPVNMANQEDMLDLGKIEWDLSGGIFQ